MKARMKHLKRVLAGVLTGVMIANTAISELPALTVKAAAGTNVVAGEIPVNPEIHYQTLDGWGTSMCWWGNIIGSWGDKDFNGNGTPDREEIAELAFSPDYLNLNIVRYNVGGGDKENTSIKRVEGLVPGWTVDMTGTADGKGTFDADKFYSKKTEDMNDAGQLWMLEAANRWRKQTAEKNGTENDIINEVFSNSPPYYMTKSGSSTGGDNASSNLKTDQYDNFALYMARAAKWIDNNLSEKFGTKVDFIEPMNEPDTNYWANGSTKQEGCVFKPGTEQSNMLIAMKNALDAEEFKGSLSHVEITGTDETSLGKAISTFKQLTTAAKNTMTTIGAHTYSGDDNERNTLRKLAKSYDKDLWMSEITKGGGTHDHNSMEEAQTEWQSKGIMADLKYMQPSAWVAWLVADSEYECLLHNENWGLIHAVFESDGPVPEYHTNLVNTNGTPKKGVPEEGYWVVTKQLYTMMQYSKYLKAGYTMIEIGDSDMCAALSPDGKELVIVAQNFSNERNTTVDLSAFANRGAVELYRTSNTENCELVEGTLDITDGILDVTLPKNSVSTYVIDVEANMDNYAQIVEADVVAPSDANVNVSDVNKFTYTGTWNDQTTKTAGASATFTFEGTHAVLMGTKSPTGGKVLVAVDNGEAQEMDLKDELEMPESILCDTGELANGKHTITVTMASEQTTTDASLTLSHARLIHGKVSMSATTIRKVISYDGALMVCFDEVNGSGSYTVKYGTSEENLDQTVTASSNNAVIKGLTNGTTYYIQVEDTLGGSSNVVSGTPEAPEGNLLYFVDVGTSNPHSLAADEQFGRYNSVLEQKYGEDPVSGKNWGYVGDNTAAYYTDSDRWESVRECPTGIEYQFDLPAGSYNVTVAMKDPWNNSTRATDLIINGETKIEGLVPLSGVTRTYKTTLEADGTLSVKAVKSASNTKESPMISYILISAYQDGEEVISEIPKPETIYTVNGVIPQFPKTVKAKTVDGSEVEKTVTWETVNTEKFTGANLSTISVEGTVDGTDYTVNQPVQIVPANLQYFIDCNWADSTQYASLNAAAGLKNEVADKAYTEGSWGYTESVNPKNGKTESGSNGHGWFDPNGGKIQYKLPMTTGNYSVTFGFYDWWYYKVRPVYLRAYFGTSTTPNVDWGVFGIDKKTAEKSTSLKLTENDLVTLSVEKESGDDPVLSWIMIQNILNQDELKSLLNQAGSLKRGDYLAESLTAVDVAVTEGMNQLLKSDATQASVDAAVTGLQSALDQLVASEADKASLQAVLDEANEIDIELYTTETTEVFSKALTDAENLLKQANIKKTQIENAKKTLQDAIKGLKKKPAEKTPEELRLDLGALIAKVEKLTSTLYTETSWSALQGVLPQSKTVFENQQADAAALKEAFHNLQAAVKALEPSSQGGEGDNKNETGNYNVVLTKEKLEANKYVLYTVNCGTPDVSEIPSKEIMGLLQSSMDQSYGADATTGAVWGLAASDANSEVVKAGDDSYDVGLSYIHMSEDITFDKEKTGFRYAFEVPSAVDNFDGILKNTYEVTVGFRNPWSTRNVNITLEGKTVETSLALTQNKWITKTYRTAVKDGELNLFVHNPNRTNKDGDPILNYICIKAVAGVPDTTKLNEAVEKAGKLQAKDYTAESWKGFDDAYAKAQAILKNPGNDPNVVDECTAALNDILKGLVTLDSLLEKAIKDYTVADSSEKDYTAESWKVYAAALKAVKDMKAANSYTEAEVTKAIADLQKAHQSLKKAEQPKPWVATLAKAIKDYTVADSNKGLYTEASWKAYKTAYQAALDLQKKDNYTEAQVTTVVANLKKAYQGLKKVEQPKPWVATLAKAIKDYKVADSKKGLYTEASWKAYKTAYQAALDLQKKDNYTEAEVTTVVANLKKAYQGLKKKPAPVKVKTIKITGSLTKLAKGKKVTLKTTVTPKNATNKSVTWSSSNQKVAKVSQKGVVTAVKKGTANITAKAKDGSKVKSKVYKITVVDHAVKKVSLKTENKTVAAGKKATIKATISTTGKNANKTLKWSTSNKKYATVSSKGVVTTKKAGAGKTVKITAQATDGSNKKASISIKIVKHAVKSVKLSGSKSVKAGKKVTIKATVKTTGKTASKKLVWSTSNKKYATVSSKGVVSTKKAGKGKTVTITAKATDGSGKKGTIKIKMK